MSSSGRNCTYHLRCTVSRYTESFCDRFQSIGFGKSTVGLILPIAMKVANHPQTAALLGNPVSITVLIAARHAPVAGKTVYLKTLTYPLLCACIKKYYIISRKKNIRLYTCNSFQSQPNFFKGETSDGGSTE